MEDIPTTLKTIKVKISDIPVPVSKHHCVSTTLINPSVSAVPSTSSTASTPIVVGPEMAIPADAYSECLNKITYANCIVFCILIRFHFNSC